jgi:uncharacterized protein (DUF58 family)
VTRTETAPRAALRFTPTGAWWLAASALIGAVAWYKSINLVLIVVYAMVALLLLNALVAWRAVRRTTAGRAAMPPVFAGERAECGIVVANGSGAPVTVTATERAGEHSNSFLVYRLPAGQRLACAAAREFPARGRFGGPVALLSGSPFGLMECERPCGPGAEIVVLPRLGYAEPDGLRRWLFRQAGGDGRARRVLRRVTTDQAEVRGVRQYRPGDALREVHGRTTARRGEVMVREYDAAPAPELVLVVEAWLPPNPTRADRERLEAALSLATTVAVTWRRAFDNPVTVAIPGTEPAIATAASEEDLREALAPLADLAGGPQPAPLPAELFRHHLARGARILVSSRPHSPYAAALSRATGKAFYPVSPADRLPWYQPPGVPRAGGINDTNG